jgi:hypothetical protein
LALSERYKSTADLPGVIPLFPLRGAILLPRSVLPLNVFEPRYLAMVQAAISGDRVIGIVQPDRQQEEEEVESPAARSTPLKAVGCAGRITTYQELDDGRLMIALSGIARFSVREEVASARPYRSARVDFSVFANDLQPGYGEAEIDRDTLIAALRRYLDARQLKADWVAVAAAPGEHLVNTLSIVSPFGPEEKQALIEAPTLKARAELLVALAEMELAAGQSGPGTRLQ